MWKKRKKEEKEEKLDKKSSVNLDTWVNVEPVPKNDNRKTMEKAPEKKIEMILKTII